MYTMFPSELYNFKIINKIVPTYKILLVAMSLISYEKSKIIIVLYYIIWEKYFFVYLYS